MWPPPSPHDLLPSMWSPLPTTTPPHHPRPPAHHPRPPAHHPIPPCLPPLSPQTPLQDGHIPGGAAAAGGGECDELAEEVRLAQLLLQRAKAADALGLLDRVLTRAPTDSQVLHLRGRCLAALGNIPAVCVGGGGKAGWGGLHSGLYPRCVCVGGGEGGRDWGRPEFWTNPPVCGCVCWG